MPRPEKMRSQAQERIDRVRDALVKIDYVCSGTLLKRMMKCGKPTCRCHEDPAARHGPYYEWTYLKGGKFVHQYASSEQATILRQAIANYRTVKKLIRTWEAETKRLIDTEPRRKP